MRRHNPSANWTPPSEEAQRAEEQRLRDLTESVRPQAEALAELTALREQQGRAQLNAPKKKFSKEDAAEQYRLSKEAWDLDQAIIQKNRELLAQQHKAQKNKMREEEEQRVLYLGQRAAQERANALAHLSNQAPTIVPPISLDEANAQIQANRVSEIRNREKQYKQQEQGVKQAQQKSKEYRAINQQKESKIRNANNPNKEEAEKWALHHDKEVTKRQKKSGELEHARLERVRHELAEAKRIQEQQEKIERAEYVPYSPIDPEEAYQDAYNVAYGQYQKQLGENAAQHEQDRFRAQAQYAGMLNTTENQIARQRQMMQNQSPIGINPELLRSFYQQGNQENVQYVPVSPMPDPYERILKNFNPEMFNPDYYPEES